MGADPDLEQAFRAGDAGAIAVARARAYTLLAALVRRGVEASTLEAVRELPELDAAVGGRSLDELGAAHQRVFGLEVFPWASVFLDPSGRPGGETTAAFAAAMAQDLGWAPDPTVAEADHLAVILDGLAFACSAEAEAAADGLAEVAARVGARRGDFARRALAGWLPALCEAVRAEQDPLFIEVMEMVRALILSEAEPSGEAEPLAAPCGPGLLALLEEPKTGLAVIADHLCAPMDSGLFLSRRAIGALARGIDVPRGFGNRRDQMEAVLRGAAEHDSWVSLLDRLRDLVHAARESSRAWPAAWVQPRLRQLEETEAGLRRLVEGRSALNDDLAQDP